MSSRIPSPVHLARTLMMGDLERVLAGTESADINLLKQAVTEENLLGKPTQRTRRDSWQHLSRLYGLNDPQLSQIGFLTLWREYPAAQPQLALAQALVHDGLLRLSGPFVTALAVGEAATGPQLATYLKAQGASYSEKTLQSAARNLLSSWSQAGLLAGTNPKRRAALEWHPAALTLLLRHAYLRGDRGATLYHSPELQALGLGGEGADALAQAAGKQGLLSYKRIGDVLEVTFPNLEEK